MKNFISNVRSRKFQKSTIKTNEKQRNGRTTFERLKIRDQQIFDNYSKVLNVFKILKFIHSNFYTIQLFLYHGSFIFSFCK